MALLWVLNFSDGRHTLLDIAERSGLAFSTIRRAADALREAGLTRARDVGEAGRSPAAADELSTPTAARSSGPVVSAGVV